MEKLIFLTDEFEIFGCYDVRRKNSDLMSKFEIFQENKKIVSAVHEPGYLYPIQDPQWETYQTLQLHESPSYRDMAVSINLLIIFLRVLEFYLLFFNKYLL